jgi:hypothetical protein
MTDPAKALRDEMNAQRKDLDECRQKLARATDSLEYWRARALRAEKDVS